MNSFDISYDKIRDSGSSPHEVHLEEKSGSFFSHMWEVFTLSTPMIGGLYLTMGVEVISLYYMGSLGDITIFAATGMAMTVMNVVVMSILFGSIRGMETLVS